MRSPGWLGLSQVQDFHCIFQFFSFHCISPLFLHLGFFPSIHFCSRSTGYSSIWTVPIQKQPWCEPTEFLLRIIPDFFAGWFVCPSGLQFPWSVLGRSCLRRCMRLRTGFNRFRQCPPRNLKRGTKRSMRWKSRCAFLIKPPDIIFGLPREPRSPPVTMCSTWESQTRKVCGLLPMSNWMWVSPQWPPESRFSGRRWRLSKLPMAGTPVRSHLTFAYVSPLACPSICRLFCTISDLTISLKNLDTLPLSCMTPVSVSDEPRAPRLIIFLTPSYFVRHINLCLSIYAEPILIGIRILSCASLQTIHMRAWYFLYCLGTRKSTRKTQCPSPMSNHSDLAIGNLPSAGPRGPQTRRPVI